MLDVIFSSRSFVPFTITFYGLSLLGLRLFALDSNNFTTNALLVSLTCAGAALTWAIDIC